MNRRAWLISSAAVAACGALLGCQPGGHIGLFGYTSAPPFDPNIRSVCIPTFKLGQVVTTPLRGLDVELTDAVVKELNSRKSPIKVISDEARADTILIGTIALVVKQLQSYNQQALPLETDLLIGVDIVWRDQRTGEVLSNPRGGKPQTGATAFDPTAVKSDTIPGDVKAVPVRIQANGRFLIQNGESTATGADAATAKLARLIVNMMEAPWQMPQPAKDATK